MLFDTRLTTVCVLDTWLLTYHSSLLLPKLVAVPNQGIAQKTYYQIKPCSSDTDPNCNEDWETHAVEGHRRVSHDLPGVDTELVLKVYRNLKINSTWPQPLIINYCLWTYLKGRFKGARLRCSWHQLREWHWSLKHWDCDPITLNKHKLCI